MQTQDSVTGMNCRGILVAAWALALGGLGVSIPQFAAAQVATPPYSISVFATNPSGASAPDSIVIWRNSVIVGYGNGVAKDGSDGKSSTIVEFDSGGHVKRTFSVPGHNDGLRVIGEDELWALQNEDGNPNLVIIDLDSGIQTPISLSAVNGGGYDDIVELNGSVYFTASNPAKNPNTDPALVRVTLAGNTATVTPVLAGTAMAVNIPDGSKIALNLQDPDSMTTDLKGNIVFVSQADAMLVFVKHPGAANQSAAVLPITSTVPIVNNVTFTIDDTVFARKGSKYLLVTDITAGAIYKIKRAQSDFEPGEAFSASDTYGIVGTLNVGTGLVTPIVTGLQSARGLAFVRERSDDHCERE